MTDQLPPYSDDAEIAVLGAVLLAPSALSAIAAEVRLAPDHFYRFRHGRIWQAMQALAADGEPVDAVTVCNWLEQHQDQDDPFDQAQRAHVYALPNVVPVAGNHVTYAKIIHAKAVWRARLDAGRNIADAALSEDQDGFARAEAQLVHSDEAQRRTWQPDDLAERLYGMLQEEQPETFPWPFPRLNKLTDGGMRRGQVTLDGAFTSMGKSVMLDQTLGHVAERPERWRTHLYFNEGTLEERLVRLAARMARVPASRIATRALTADERARVAKAMERIPFGVTDCTGWTAEDVVRDMVHRRFDVVGVDMLNQFPGARRREELEEMSRLFNQAAKPARANCHLILAVHLNRNRAGQAVTWPFPTLADIRDSGHLANDADNVLFVHRDQDEDTGEPQATGVIRFAKARAGRVGGLQVLFEEQFQRFVAAGVNAETRELRAA